MDISTKRIKDLGLGARTSLSRVYVKEKPRDLGLLLDVFNIMLSQEAILS